MRNFAENCSPVSSNSSYIYVQIYRQSEYSFKMSDDVITLDSSDDEPSPAATREPIADQLRRRCKQLNIKPVKAQAKNNKSRTAATPTNIMIANSQPHIRGPTNATKIISIAPSVIGNVQVTKTTVRKTPAQKTPQQKAPVQLPQKFIQIAPAPIPIRPNVSIAPTKIGNVTILPSNSYIPIDQPFNQMPVIVNSSSLAQNNPQRQKTKTANLPSALKIRNITNTQRPNVGKLCSNITITQNGKAVPREQLMSGNKRGGGSISTPARKKQKVALDNSVKKAVDNIVRKVAKQQSINLDGCKNSSEIIPTVEIDDDDDDPVTTVSNNMEIPIEYEPDNSKENVDLDCINVPVADPLELDLEESSHVDNEGRNNSIISTSVDIADVVIEDTDPIEIPLTESQSKESCIEIVDSDLQNLKESIGDISSSSVIGVIRKRVSDEEDSDCVEKVEEECPSNDSVSVLSKCDFYTPKKQKEDNSLSEKIDKNVSRNMSEEFVNLPLNKGKNDETEKIVAVPVQVKVSLTPEDKKRVEMFQRNIAKKRVKLFNLDQPPKEKPANHGSDQIENRTINDTYQRFIDLCFKLDSSDDMKKIVDKKVKAYYMSVDASFTESRSFLKFMEGKIKDISESPGSLFLFIKDVVDELKVRRVKKKDGPVTFNEREKSPARLNKSKSDDEKSSDGEDGEEEDEVLKSKIRKLERAMRKLNKAIKKLQEREVDCDDENSAYILEDRYKSRLIRIYQKLCQLTGEREEACSQRSRALKGLSRLTLCGGRFPKLVSAVKAAANSRPHWFPDYVDVLKCVEHCAKEQGLSLRQDELHREAREAFVEIGTLLQQKRREAEYEDFSCMMGSNVDPAEEDSKLAEALEKNREISKNKEMEVINKFVEKQYNLKLVPEDVPDGDADKSEGSDDESGDEEEKSKREDNNTNKTVITKADVHVEGNMKSRDDKGDNVKEIKDNLDSNDVSCITSGDINTDDVNVDKKIDKSNISDSTEQVPSKLDDVEMSEVGKTVESVADCETAGTSKTDQEIDDDDCKSNSSFSLVDLITSDSRDSFNSGVEADTEDSRPNRRFKKLKSVRPSSALSGVDLLNDDSGSADTRKDSDVMDVDESIEEVNTTVIEKTSNIVTISTEDKLAYEEVITSEENKTIIDDTTSVSISSSDVLTMDDDKEFDIPLSASVSEDTDITFTEVSKTLKSGNSSLKKTCVTDITLDSDGDKTLISSEVVIEETNSGSNQDVAMDINIFDVDQSNDVDDVDQNNGVDDVDQNNEDMDDGDDTNNLLRCVKITECTTINYNSGRSNSTE